jgi:hypothetical protein
MEETTHGNSNESDNSLHSGRNSITSNNTPANENGGSALHSDPVQKKKKKSAFDIDESKLIQLDRQVEKINIGMSCLPMCPFSLLMNPSDKI